MLTRPYYMLLWLSNELSHREFYRHILIKFLIHGKNFVFVHARLRDRLFCLFFLQRLCNKETYRQIDSLLYPSQWILNVTEGMVMISIPAAAILVYAPGPEALI